MRDWGFGAGLELFKRGRDRWLVVDMVVTILLSG